MYKATSSSLIFLYQNMQPVALFSIAIKSAVTKLTSRFLYANSCSAQIWTESECLLNSTSHWSLLGEVQPVSHNIILAGTEKNYAETHVPQQNMLADYRDFWVHKKPLKKIHGVLLPRNSFRCWSTTKPLMPPDILASGVCSCNANLVKRP